MQNITKGHLEEYVDILAEYMQTELEIDWVMGQPKVLTKIGRNVTTRDTNRAVFYQIRSAIQAIRIMKDERG